MYRYVCSIYLLTHDADDIEEQEEDSSGDSDEELASLLMLVNAKCPRVSIVNFYEDTVQAYPPNTFVTHFRIKPELFWQLAAEYEETEEYRRMLLYNPSRVLKPDKTVAIFLWFAAHEACSFRDVSDRFNISTSTVHWAIVRVTAFLSNMASRVIRWPTAADMQEDAQWYEGRCNIPGIMGIVDGTKVRFEPPKANMDDYIDRHGDTTLTIQGTCNAKKKFIDAFFGFPGSVHDARVFRNSPLYDKVRQLPLGYRVLADSAYPCLRQVLPPVKNNGHLSAAEVHFNRALSSQRVHIEHTFGILKQRFRQLYFCKLRGNKLLCHFFRACVVLHNLADETDLQFQYPAPTEDEDHDADDYVPAIADNGKTIRATLIEYLYELV